MLCANVKKKKTFDHTCTIPAPCHAATGSRFKLGSAILVRTKRITPLGMDATAALGAIIYLDNAFLKMCFVFSTAKIKLKKIDFRKRIFTQTLADIPEWSSNQFDLASDGREDRLPTEADSHGRPPESRQDRPIRWASC
jgi:hypothetical protein